MIRSLFVPLVCCVLIQPAVQAQDVVGASYRAHLAAAEASMRLGEPAEARRWLDGAPTEMRGWEWRHLDTLLDQSTIIMKNPAATVHSMDLHPDGTRIVAALSDGGIVILEARSGDIKTKLQGHAGGTFCVRYSPDGTKIASGGADRVARVWDARNGEAVREFNVHKFPVTSVAWTLDGQNVVSAAYYTDKTTPIEGRVHLWNVASGEVRRTFKGGVKPLSCVAMSPDGTRIAAGSWDSCVFVWRIDGPEGDLPARLGGPPGPNKVVRINSIGFSADGTLLAAGSDSQWTKVYRIDDGSEVATLASGTANFGAAAFAPDDATLATGGDNGAVVLWRTRDWSRSATLPGHTQGIRTLAWRRDNSMLYSGGIDGTIRAWDPRFNAFGGLRTRFGEGNLSVAFSRDGALLACSGNDRTIGAVSAHTGAEVLRLKTQHEREVCTAAISPDGQSIASCSWDGTLRVHDMDSRREIARVALPDGAAYFAWNPEGTRVAAALRNKSTVIVRVKDWTIEHTLAGHTGAVNTVAWNSDGSQLVTGGMDASARVWNTTDGTCIAVMPSATRESPGHIGTIESAVFVPETNLVATASHDGSIRVWNGATGNHVRLLLAGSDPIYRIAASPDGKRLAAGGRFLYILDPLHALALVREHPLHGTIWHLDWSPDGQRLAVGSWSGEIVVFDQSVD